MDGSAGPAVDLVRSALALARYDTAGARAAVDLATTSAIRSDPPPMLVSAPPPSTPSSRDAPANTTPRRHH